MLNSGFVGLPEIRNRSFQLVPYTPKCLAIFYLNFWIPAPRSVRATGSELELGWCYTPAIGTQLFGP
jgi:hypothetical protein